MLLMELPDAGRKIIEEVRYPDLSQAERVFSFPEPTAHFVSTGVTSNDEFSSIIDGDPVVKSFLSMKINLGHIVRPTNRCKGLFLYVKGDLTVEGTLSMTARGCQGSGKYVGIDKYKRSVFFDETDIFSRYRNILTISKIGGLGGAARIATTSGTGKYQILPGNNGESILNGSGGGGSGCAFSSHGGTVTSGRGASGTSFSGGAGGGGCCNVTNSVNGYNAAEEGGAGGAGRVSIPSGNGLTRASGGGAGNPGGAPHSVNGGTGVSGSIGTGGLLILFVEGNILIGNSGAIESCGCSGGRGETASGGGSGGGIVVIACGGQLFNPDRVSVAGGAGGINGQYNGGAGGDGSKIITAM